MIINKELISKLADDWGETDNLETVYETDNVLGFLNDFKVNAEEIYKSEDE